MKAPQILLTNDDGIKSPGLWAAAAALSEIGFVHVAAPRDQFSGAGRCLSQVSDGIIHTHKMVVNGREWQVHAVGGTPAQVVLHGALEIMTKPPDLVVSGINYGENLGTGITASGTVGAALEAAELGFPALAISLETEPHHHLSYSEEVDFSTAAYFTTYFSRMLLKNQLPMDVDLLKVDVPCGATPDTAWKITRLSRSRYFIPTLPERESWDIPDHFGYELGGNPEQDEVDTDVYALRVEEVVSLTPLSLDLTSRVDPDKLNQTIRNMLG
jgi:5'-nucleotidase